MKIPPFLSRAHRFWLLVLFTTALCLALQTGTPVWSAADGQALYEAGRYAEAAQVLQQTAEAARQRGDRIQQAATLANLSQAQQQLGDWAAAEQSVTSALQLLQEPPVITPAEIAVLAQVRMVEGQLQMVLGRSQAALESWTQAAKTYERINDLVGVTNSQINQAQALQQLGFYPRALEILEVLQTSLQNQADSEAKFTVLQSLGDTLRMTGELTRSRQIVQQALALAERLRSPALQASAHLSLGQTLQPLATIAVRQRIPGPSFETVLRAYQQAVAISPNPTLKAQSQLAQLNLLIDARALLTDNAPPPLAWKRAQTLALQILPTVATLPPNRTTLYLKINLADALIRLKQDAAAEGVLIERPEQRAIAQLLTVVVQQATALQDRQAQTRALGTLAGLYEQTQQFEQAQRLTQQALSLSLTSSFSDTTYLWQAQMGRLQNRMGDRQGAIQSYEAALETLRGLRQNLAAVGTQTQFSFRRSVEPVYRQLVNLLLTETPVTATNLDQARAVIEELQVEELNDFFRESCLTGRRVQADQIDPQAAVIYPIQLMEETGGARLEVIVSLPRTLEQQAQNNSSNPNQNKQQQQTQNRNQNQTQDGNPPLLYHRSFAFTPAEVEQMGGRHPVDAIAQSLFDLLSQPDRNPAAFATTNAPAQQLYRWLIAPFVDELEAHSIKTLVFVADKALRGLPMAALYDGEKFLIERYAVALAPSLKLIESEPLNREDLRILIGGISKPQQGLSALPNVVTEVQEIQANFPGNPVLLNEQLTNKALAQTLNNNTFSIVHLATHGTFSSNIEDTRLFTWGEQLNLNQLRNLLQSADLRQPRPIELLVLSACQTAVGDEQATLGLAGIAIRARARSTIATLWLLQDKEALQLFDQIYQQLQQPGTNRAEALRQAQLSLLTDPNIRRQPYRWAATVLVGNWK